MPLGILEGPIDNKLMKSNFNSFTRIIVNVDTFA